jgi:phosphoglycolate phosphatase-like HAD superfamily hydrolase
VSNLIVFDLDGVITSEEAYWDAAGLTLHELVHSPQYWNIGAARRYHPVADAEESRRVSRAIFPESEILALKARAINSNWDTCYAAVCLHLIDLLALSPGLPALLPPRPWDAQWIAAFRAQMTSAEEQRGKSAMQGDRKGYPYMSARSLSFTQKDELHPFESPVFHGYVGLELINRFDVYASEVLGHPIEGVFSRHSPFWAFCQDIFQEWYLGDELYTREYGHGPVQPGKPGCIHFEQPLLPTASVRATLERLRQQGYVLGFATGRSLMEAEVPLKAQGLLSYFDEAHISTYDNVERAEARLRARGDQSLLSKPHPFPFLAAVNPAVRSGMAEQEELSLTSARADGGFVVVGDSTSDILGGHAAGALTVAVLTGARTAEARAMLAQSGPDFTINDITELPTLLAHIDSLATIQRLQFSEREKAERLLQRWFLRHMNLATESATLQPKAVSLNSFNGFYRSDGKEYFFKTHVEEQGVLAEYYHAELLHRVGYNIVMPLRTLHEEGQQMVIYPVVRWPVMFDLMRAVETGNAGDITLEALALAEQRECERMLGIYRSTFAFSTEEEHARAPIHQLFWHRLAGGRFKSFYAGKHIRFPAGAEPRESCLSFDDVLSYRWIINGIPYERTLGELVERTKEVLHPARAATTVIGHGDAHFGNVFLEQAPQGSRKGHTVSGHPGQGIPAPQAGSRKGRPYISPVPGHPGAPPTDTGLRYLYFDPAFAGRHTPLLDVIKPLFHNVFATWMYFPYDVARELHLSVTIRNATVIIEHDYTLTPVRQAILQTKIEHLLIPVVAEMRSHDALPGDWFEMMRLALMCCPLLTINLLDEERIPASTSWLGLSQAVQMGNEGIPFWRIDP